MCRYLKEAQSRHLAAPPPELKHIFSRWIDAKPLSSEEVPAAPLCIFSRNDTVCSVEIL